MTQERPILRADFRAFADEVRSAFASGARQVRVQLAGQTLHLWRASDEEFLLRAGAEQTAARVLLGSTARAADYPPDLPFIPGELVMLSGPERFTAAVWVAPPDRAALVDEVHRQCIAADWTLEGETSVPPLGGKRRSYRKGRTLRYLMESEGTVSLMQKPVSIEDAGSPED